MWESPLLTRRLGTSCRAVSTVAAEFFTCIECVEVHACVRVRGCASLHVRGCTAALQHAILACDRAPTWSANAGRRGTGAGAAQAAWHRAGAAHMKGERGERQRRDSDEGGGVGRRRPRAEEALRLAAAAVPINTEMGEWTDRPIMLTDIR